MTRLLWVIIFALAVGAVLLIFARAFTTADPVSRRLVAIARSGEELGRRFPGHRFRVQVSSPGPNRREVVLSIQPGAADSAELAALPDSAADWLLGRLDLEDFDSLRVALFDSVVRTRPPGRSD
jgi:hypothetical protein